MTINVALALKITNNFKPPHFIHCGIWFELVKAVPLSVGSSRLNPRQLILALKEQLELSFVLAVGRLAKIPDSIEPNHTCVCATLPTWRSGKTPPTACPRLARGEGVGLERELQMELSGSIFRRESDDSTLLFRVQINIFLDKYIF